mgnify:CR=1 FL=1
MAKCQSKVCMDLPFDNSLIECRLAYKHAGLHRAFRTGPHPKLQRLWTLTWKNEREAVDGTRAGPDCPGCTDYKSEGTHSLGTRQHP